MRRDAARWVRPQQIAELEDVTPRVMLQLLFKHPPLRAVAWFRLASLARSLGIRGVSGWNQRRLLRLYVLELAPGAKVGGGLYVAHPVGCVLSAESIDENVSVIAHVTFGARSDVSWPRIGDRVFIGAGAKVLGGIEIGDDARVGANAVVLDAVAAGSTVAGLPARPVGRAG